MASSLVASDSGGAAAAPRSAVYAWDALAVKTTGAGARRDVADGPTATLENFECHITTLKPGLHSHPPHRHAQEELIILKEGRLEASINGRTERIGPGGVLFLASNDLHNVRNIGEEPATYWVFNVRTAATRSAPATPAAENAVPGRLGSSVFDWQKLPVQPTDVGQRRPLFDASTVTLVHLEGHITTLNAGVTSHPPHRHPDEEILVIKEGEVDVTIEGRTQRVGPGSVCFFASKDSHGARTVGASPSTYYAIRFVSETTPRGADRVGELNHR